jgi:hypothetical protein
MNINITLLLGLRSPLRLLHMFFEHIFYTTIDKIK